MKEINVFKDEAEEKQANFNPKRAKNYENFWIIHLNLKSLDIETWLDDEVTDKAITMSLEAENRKEKN